MGDTAEMDVSSSTLVRRLFGRFSSGGYLPVILQTETTECGLACLAMVARYHGHDIDLRAMRLKYPNSLKGTNLAKIIRIAGDLQLSGRPLRVDMEGLPLLKTPCILHWEHNHFVVLKEATRQHAIIHDPARGEVRMSWNEVSRCFTGIALELIRVADFKPISQRRSIPLQSVTGQVRGIVPAFVQILALTIIGELFTMASPMLLQWTMDQVVVTSDRSMLLVMMVGFCLAIVIQCIVVALRSWLVTWAGVVVNVQWSTNLVSHLLRLPLGWFEKRHIGDIASRLGSVQAIQRTLSTQFVGTVIDGVMSLATIVLLAFYNAWMAVLVFSMAFLYACVRRIYYGPLKRASEEQIVCSAKQQSVLMEIIRGILPIKLANQQYSRRAMYGNATVDTFNRDARFQYLMIACATASQFIFGTGRVLVIGFSTYLVLNQSFSVGMMVAFIAYADQFALRISSLVDKASDVRMLSLHVERISDIALSEPEDVQDTGLGMTLSDASIEVRNVSFRYADNEPWIIRNCSFRIEDGQSVAITGPSGCGKTTLAKIILGLIDPSEGEVLFSGMPLKQIGIRNYRDMIGAVMQDDQLFAGSIADNIAFGDPDASMDRVIEAARLAAIHEDVCRMPMAYFSLVGDMGSALSGGQKQRVILARALYRKPSLLVLDEATSHLDVERERIVNAALAEVKATRIVIAHRPETIEASDCRIDLSSVQVPGISMGA